MKNLRHPNIVRLIGVCWDEFMLACLLEYVTNGSLEDHLRKDVKIPSTERLTWTHSDLKKQKHTFKELEVMKRSMENLNDERGDELREVLVSSKDVTVDRIIGKGGL